MRKFITSDALLIGCFILVLLVAIVTYLRGYDLQENNGRATVDQSDLLFQKPKSDEYAIGNQEARYTVVYYLDYDCPYCKGALAIAERITREFPDTRFIFRDNPLSTIHPEAFVKAVTAQCLSNNGNNFFQVVNAMLSSQPLNVERLDPTRFATSSETLAKCKEDRYARQYVLRSQSEAGYMGLFSTPSIIIIEKGKVVMKANHATERKIRFILKLLHQKKEGGDQNNASRLEI